MKIVGKIVGINLVVLIIYFMGVSFVGGFESELTQVLLLGLLLIPIHVAICLIVPHVITPSLNETEEEYKMYKRGYYLSALVVLVVGFSLCTRM